MAIGILGELLACTMCSRVGCCQVAANSEVPPRCHEAKRLSPRVHANSYCAGPGVDAFDSYGGGILPARTCSANQPARAPTANDYGDINHAMVRPPIRSDLVQVARLPTGG